MEAAVGEDDATGRNKGERSGGEQERENSRGGGEKGARVCDSANAE